MIFNIKTNTIKQYTWHERIRLSHNLSLTLKSIYFYERTLKESKFRTRLWQIKTVYFPIRRWSIINVVPHGERLLDRLPGLRNFRSSSSAHYHGNAFPPRVWSRLLNDTTTFLLSRLPSTDSSYLKGCLLFLHFLVIWRSTPDSCSSWLHFSCTRLLTCRSTLRGLPITWLSLCC